MKLSFLLALGLILSGCAQQPVSRAQPDLPPRPAERINEWLPAPASVPTPVVPAVTSALPPPPQLSAAFQKPVRLTLRDAPLNNVIAALAKTTGLNFVLDQAVNPDQRVNLAVRDLPFADVFQLILKANQLESQVVADNTLLIYPLQADKLRSYRPVYTRSFSLANADAKQVQNLFKQVLKARDLYVDERLNVVVLRDTADIIRQAEFLVARLDVADPEVMLEVEVLEVSRNQLQELGVKFPDQIGFGLLQGATTTTVVSNGIAQTSTIPGGLLAEGNVDLRRGSLLTAYAANPLLLLNLRGVNGDNNLLANPRIRVKHREKARIHIGEKLPVFTTTSTANVGVAASVSYLDVGLKLDVEPTIHEADEIGIKMGLEVSSVVREVLGPQQSLAYIVGTRSTSTSLRLNNGQTQVLAGLISDEERHSVNQIPGLGNLPTIGRLFGSNRDSTAKTEIILLITPRVLRAPVRPTAAQQIWFGGANDLRESSDGGVIRSPEAAPVPTPVPATPAAAQ